MVVHPGDKRVKVQVGWIIQQLQMIDYMVAEEKPDMDVLRREVKFLLTGVMEQWAAEKQERFIPLTAKSKEDLLKEFGW